MRIGKLSRPWLTARWALTAALLPGCSPVDSARITAYQDCVAFATQMMGAAAAPEFPDYGEQEVTNLGSSTFRVQTTVEAANAEGARVQSSVSCTIQYSEDGDSMHVEQISIN